MFFGILSLMVGGVLIWASLSGQLSTSYSLTKKEIEYVLYLGLALALYGIVHSLFYGRRRDVDEGKRARRR